jgi:hypothetical protein
MAAAVCKGATPRIPLPSFPAVVASPKTNLFTQRNSK